MNITQEMTHIQKQNELKDKAMLFDKFMTCCESFIDKLRNDEETSVQELHADFVKDVLSIRRDGKNYGF